MKKTLARKLVVSRQTVRALTAPQLDDVVGGLGTIRTCGALCSDACTDTCGKFCTRAC